MAEGWITEVRLLADRDISVRQHFHKDSGAHSAEPVALFSETNGAGALGDCQLHRVQRVRISGGKTLRPLLVSLAKYCLWLGAKYFSL